MIVNGKSVGKPPTWTIEVNQAITIVANFTPINYTTIVSVYPPQAQSDGCSVSGGGNKKHYNDAINLTATAATGWKFDKWSGDYSSSTNTLDFIMPDRDVVVTAEFLTDSHGAVDDPFRLLKPEEKTFLFNMRGEIAAARGAIGRLRVCISMGRFDQYVGRDLANACAHIVSLSAKAPKIFQPVAGVCAGIDALALAAANNSFMIVERIERAEKSNFLVAQWHLTHALFQRELLRSSINIINGQINKIESTLEKCYTEADLTP